MRTERILDLAEEFFRLARDRVPQEFLRGDLTMPQLKVLYALYIDGPQTVSALASAQGLSLPTMTGVLARLARRGYLERRRDSEDARRIISDLSQEGRSLMDGLWASGREALAAVLDHVPSEDLHIIERAMEALVRALESSRKEAAVAGAGSGNAPA